MAPKARSVKASTSTGLGGGTGTDCRARLRLSIRVSRAQCLSVSSLSASESVFSRSDAAIPPTPASSRGPLPARARETEAAGSVKFLVSSHRDRGRHGDSVTAQPGPGA